ncbi:GerMN domain-containing protein [Lachnospiraceae bacterium 46-15]
MGKSGKFFSVLLLSLALAGCQKEQTEISGYQIYRVNADGTVLEPEDYTPQASGGDALIQEFVDRLGEVPAQVGHKKAIPDGVGITSVKRTEQNLRVDFNGTYSKMDNITEVFCRAAVVKTLVQVPGVDTVEFTVNGQELADIQGNPIGVMSDDSFIDTKGEGINSYHSASLVLYFADKDGKKLVKEMRNIHYSSNESLERLVVEELMEGPVNEQLCRTVPADTKILDVAVEKDTCIISLDKAYGQAAGTAVTPEAAVYAVVNSICENCDVDKVQIKIEGESGAKFRNAVDLSHELTKNEEIVVQPEENGKITPGVGVDPALKE